MNDMITGKPPRGKSIEELRQLVAEKSEGRIELLTPVKLKRDQPYQFRCSACGTVFVKPMADFKRLRTTSYGCPACHERSVGKRYTRKEVEEILGEEGYRLESDEFTTICDKIYLKCPDPEHPTYPTTIDKFLSGSRCPYHMGCRVSFNSIKIYAESPKRLFTHGARFRLLTEEQDFENSTNTKLLLDCLDCGHGPFERSWVSFSNSANPCGCPQCAHEKSGSWAVNLMARLLRSTGLNFEFEKKYPDLKSPYTGYALRYDLFVPDLNSAIEVNGKQHYEPCKFGSQTWDVAKERFRLGQEYDSLKVQFAKEKGVHLLKLPLYDEETRKNRTKIEIISAAVSIVSGLYRGLHGTEPEFDSEVFVFDQGKINWARDKVWRGTGGAVSFVDDRFYGVKGHSYLMRCELHSDHGTFHGILDTTPPRCPVCTRQSLRERHHHGRERVLKLLIRKHGERISFLDEEYVNTAHYHRFHCTEHGEFTATLTNVLLTKSGSCPDCSPKPFCHGVSPKDLKEAHFNKIIVPAVAVEPGYQMLTKPEEYGGVMTKFYIKHIECGKEFGVRWDAWKRGSRCPHHREIRPAHNRKDPEEVRLAVARAFGGEFKLIDPYQGMRVKHQIRHIQTGTVITATIDNFLRDKFSHPN